MLVSYIYVKRIYVGIWTGWSFECLYEWRMYLRLGVPAVMALLIEYTNFEMGTYVLAGRRWSCYYFIRLWIFKCFFFKIQLAISDNVQVSLIGILISILALVFYVIIKKKWNTFFSTFLEHHITFVYWCNVLMLKFFNIIEIFI